MPSAPTVMGRSAKLKKETRVCVRKTRFSRACEWNEKRASQFVLNYFRMATKNDWTKGSRKGKLREKRPVILLSEHNLKMGIVPCNQRTDL